MRLLESTLPAGHSQNEYADALVALASVYVYFMDKITGQFDIVIQQNDRLYFLGFLRH